MDVRCPQCQTLYELEERQLQKGAVTLKCSRCQHVFRFESGSEFVQENQRRWMVNSSRDGAILYLNDFTDLHRWIMEKKVRPRDTISRTGDKWVELASIPEFAPIFIVVESISDLTGSPEDSHIATRVREGTPASAPADAPRTNQPSSEVSAERPRVKTEVQFPDASGSMPAAKAPTAPSRPANNPNPPRPRTEEPTRRARPQQPTPGELPPRPAGKTPVDAGDRPTPAPREKPASEQETWSIAGDDDPRRNERLSADYPAIQPRSRLPAVLFVVVLLLAGGAAAIYFMRPDLVATYVPALQGNDAVVALGESTPDASVDLGAVEQAEADPAALVGAAYSAAFEARDQRHAEIFDGAIFAIHQPMGEALDLATTTAAKAAEGGLTDERLKDARRALERGRLRKAEDLFEEVLEFEPRNADATAGLGFIYLDQSKPERAAKQFQKAIKQGGGDGSAYIGLGTAKRQLNDPRGAYEAYDLYLGRYPRGEKASIARYQLDQLRKQLGM